MSRLGQAAWGSRTPRERALAATIGIALGIVVYLVLISALDRSRLQVRANVATLRIEAAKVEQRAAEIERLRGLPAQPQQQGELRALIDVAAASAAWPRGEMRVEARSADEIQVALGSVPFNAWLTGVTILESQQVRLETCRIESLSTPGRVSVIAVFVRSTSR